MEPSRWWSHKSQVTFNLFTVCPTYISKPRKLTLSILGYGTRNLFSRSLYTLIVNPKPHKHQSFIPSKHPHRLLRTISKTHLLAEKQQTLGPCKLRVFFSDSVDKGFQIMRSTLVSPWDILGHEDGVCILGHAFGCVLLFVGLLA